MVYRVLLTPAARRQLSKLPPEARKQLAPVLDRLADEPRPPGVVSLKGTAQAYRVRDGDYRVLYEVDDHKHIVIVYRIGDRRDVYRRRR
jgi:mRNA interferase RelE/StbE